MDFQDPPGFLGFGLDFEAFYIQKRKFFGLQAQRSTNKVSFPDDQNRLTPRFFEPQTLVIRTIFGRIGQNSAPEAPLELSAGLSILISNPRSVSEDQMAQKRPRNGQDVKSKIKKNEKSNNLEIRQNQKTNKSKETSK